MGTPLRGVGKTDYFSTHGWRRSGFEGGFDEEAVVLLVLFAAARALLEKKLVEFAIA